MASISPETLSTLRAKFGNTVTANQLCSFDMSVYNKVVNGALVKIKRGVYSLDGDASIASESKSTEVAKPAMSEAEMSALIAERFEVLDILSESVVMGATRSVVVSGAPGVGKSFTLEQKLAKAEATKRIKSCMSIKGSMSAIGLFVTLYENRKPGQVLLLDDLDSIFGDEEAMNLLKGALDTSEKRRISWMKDSSFLADRDIPRTFDYQGQIVFLTNVDMEKVVEKQGKMAPHMGALLSRAVFLDLGIHTNQQVMIRVKHVLKDSTMAKDLKLSVAQTIQISEWMESNIAKLRSVSLRTVIQIAGFMKAGADWQKIARATMLKQSY